MIYPSSFETKTGFDYVRHRVRELCSLEGGATLVDDMVMSTDFDDISQRLRSTAEMLSLNRAGTPVPIGAANGMTSLLGQLRIPGSFLPATEVRSLAVTLEAFGAVSDFFAARRPSDDGPAGDDSGTVPCLQHIAAALVCFPGLLAAIGRVVDKFGEVKDSASAELAEIRRAILSTSGSVNMAMRRVMARAVAEGLLDSDAAPTMRDGRLVLPVPPMNKRRINGIVHDESASGKTVFIEPAEVVSANNRIRELQMEEHRETVRILTALAAELRPHIPDMEQSLAVMAELDFINAKALFAAECGGMLPQLHREPQLEWYHAVHPGLLYSLQRQGKEVVPLDITLTPERRILVISGPNAGGKSICLKTVGVVQYMAQCGLLPPMYENSHMGVFTDIFVDIGDDQSLEDDLSTYSSHLRNMNLLLRKGRPTGLLLIDEFGSGTEPQIGGALAQAILRQLNNRHLWGVITTHYHNLKQFAEDTDGLVNGSMLYDRHLMKPLFKLSIGNPGSSFALEIARKTGLPPEVVADAEAIVGSDYVNLDKYLLDIARDRKYWENKRQNIRQKEKKIDDVLERYESEAEKLRDKRREILEDARQEAKRIIDGSNAAVERTIAAIRNAQAERERTLEERRRLKAEREAVEKTHIADHPLLHKAPGNRRRKKQPAKPAVASRKVAVGDIVRLDGEGVPGKVLAIDGNKGTVAFGMLKTTVELSRLQHTMAQLPKASTGGASFISASTSDDMRRRQLNFNREIDVRGMRADEAIQAVTYFIDDAIQFSAGRVRILHGTGTGALRQAIRQYLDTVPGVASYRDEHVQFGGAGITVVELV